MIRIAALLAVIAIAACAPTKMPNNLNDALVKELKKHNEGEHISR